MPTCCRARPTSQMRCPSCSPSTSKLCCAFSPLPWLLTSKPWPGRGFLELSWGSYWAAEAQSSLVPSQQSLLWGAHPGVQLFSALQQGQLQRALIPRMDLPFFQCTLVPPVFPAGCCSVPVGTEQIPPPPLRKALSALGWVFSL